MCSGDGLAAVEYRLVATGAIVQEPGNPADGGHANPREVVNFPVGHAFLEEGYYLPAVHQRLQLGRRASVQQETPALVR